MKDVAVIDVVVVNVNWFSPGRFSAKITSGYEIMDNATTLKDANVKIRNHVQGIFVKQKVKIVIKHMPGEFKPKRRRIF